MDKDLRLNVFHNGSQVGTLAQLHGLIYFSYTAEWIASGFSISPRSLPLSNVAFQANGRYFEGLFGVFADSLPDGWGIRLAMRRLAEKGISYADLSPLEKLSYLGEDGLGGLNYVPCLTEENTQYGDADYETIAQAAMEFQEEDTSQLDLLFAKAGSSGGARPKAHIRFDGEEWIVKFPERKDDRRIGVMEHEYALAAKECGIAMSPCRLLPSTKCDGYFATKRFDREKGRRIHVLSLSGFLENPHDLGNLDYLTLLQSIAFLTQAKDEVIQGFRRACFNVFAQNRDDHGKNFSFLYDEKKKMYRLAPAYDLTFTPGIREHEMMVMGNGDPGEKDLLALARKMDIPQGEAKAIIAQVKTVVAERLGKWVG